MTNKKHLEPLHSGQRSLCLWSFQTQVRRAPIMRIVIKLTISAQLTNTMRLIKPLHPGYLSLSSRRLPTRVRRAPTIPIVVNLTFPGQMTKMRLLKPLHTGHWSLWSWRFTGRRQMTRRRAGHWTRLFPWHITGPSQKQQPLRRMQMPPIHQGNRQKRTQKMNLQMTRFPAHGTHTSSSAQRWLRFIELNQCRSQIVKSNSKN